MTMPSRVLCGRVVRLSPMRSLPPVLYSGLACAELATRGCTMKRRLPMLVAAVIFGAVIGHTVPGSGAFNTGNGYVLLPSAEKGGYVIGLADGIAWASGISYDLTWLATCVEGWTNTQIAEVFEGYLRSNRGERHKDAPFIFEQAMRGACE